MLLCRFERNLSFLLRWVEFCNYGKQCCLCITHASWTDSKSSCRNLQCEMVDGSGEYIDVTWCDVFFSSSLQLVSIFKVTNPLVDWCWPSPCWQDLILLVYISHSVDLSRAKSRSSWRCDGSPDARACDWRIWGENAACGWSCWGQKFCWVMERVQKEITTKEQLQANGKWSMNLD